MANILGIGIAAVDIVNITDGYPHEDDEVRAVEQRISRGGNATNSLVVLSQLGHKCQWIGTITDDTDSEVIRNDLSHHNVDFSLTEFFPKRKTPVSYITLNRNSGSRTIVHYRDLPELSASHFSQLDIGTPDWIHLEGRNTRQTLKIIEQIKKKLPEVPLSIEIEKQREQLEILFSIADVYFFSRQFTIQAGHKSAESLLAAMQKKNPHSLLVCTWGEKGAFALQDDSLIHAAATPIDAIVDSIGAGDVFNAAFIDGSLKSFDTQSCLEYACGLAAKKCQKPGLNGLF